MAQQMTDIELAKQLQESELLKESKPASSPKQPVVVKKSLERTKSVPIQLPTDLPSDPHKPVSFRSQAESLRRMSSIPGVTKYEVINEEEPISEEDDYKRRLKKEQEDLSLAKYLQEQEDVSKPPSFVVIFQQAEDA